MPGILHHFYFCEEVCWQMKEKLEETQSPFSEEENHIHLGKSGVDFDKRLFFLGSTMPDTAAKKDRAHCRVASQFAPGLLVPELYWARTTLERAIDDRILRLGAYSHLYLDKHFIEQFLWPQFTWDFENDAITSRHTGETMTVKDFFSRRQLYRGYATLNRAIIEQDLVDLRFIRSLPDWPLPTGSKIFDERREETWRAEMDRYLSPECEAGVPLFDTDEFLKFIRDRARAFVAFEMTDFFK